MALALINESTLSDIADSIRLKLSSQDTYLPSEMPAAIESISGGGSLDKTVTFKVDGSNYAVHSVASGNNLVAPYAPTKSGFYFRGWGVSASAASMRSFPYVPTADAETLFANWDAGSGAAALVSGLGASNPASVSVSKEAGFPSSFDEWTDSNGNVYVKIPTMYRKVISVVDGQITVFIISTVQVDADYHPYSCFVAPDGETVLPYVCIGKYCSSAINTCNSVNATPVTQTIGNGRSKAQALGNGYQLYDWQIQKLFVDLALVNYGSVDFNPGRTISNYMGIYNLDKYTWVDGVSKDGTTWRFAKNPGNYIDNAGSSAQGYQAAGYAAPTSSSFIIALGYDASGEFFNYPSAVGGTQSTYYCDKYYYSAGNTPVFSDVGLDEAARGLWHCNADNGWSVPRNVRLCYRPVST